jgi:hypothetical protein
LNHLESPKRALCATSIGAVAFHYGYQSRLSGNIICAVSEHALGQSQALLFLAEPIFFSDQKALERILMIRTCVPSKLIDEKRDITFADNEIDLAHAAAFPIDKQNISAFRGESEVPFL